MRAELEVLQAAREGDSLAFFCRDGSHSSPDAI